MRARHLGAWFAAILLMVWSPVTVFVLAIIGGVVGGRKLGQAHRRRQMAPMQPYIPDWQLQYIPIEQRDWVRRNLL